MAQKKEITEDLKYLKSKIQSKKVIIGADRVLKALKSGQLETVLLANNCPLKLKEDLDRYVNLAKVKLVELGMSNEELGVFCKTNFFVSALGVIVE